MYENYKRKLIREKLIMNELVIDGPPKVTETWGDYYLLLTNPEDENDQFYVKMLPTFEQLEDENFPLPSYCGRRNKVVEKKVSNFRKIVWFLKEKFNQDTVKNVRET